MPKSCMALVSECERLLKRLDRPWDAAACVVTSTSTWEALHAPLVYANKQLAAAVDAGVAREGRDSREAGRLTKQTKALLSFLSLMRKKGQVSVRACGPCIRGARRGRGAA